MQKKLAWISWILWYSPAVLIAITAPKQNDRGPQYMERVFGSILGSIGKRDGIQLEYGQHNEGVGIFVRCVDQRRTPILQHLEAKYPNCSFTQIDDVAFAADPSAATWTADLLLSPELFPILRHKQFEELSKGTIEDPLESLLGVIQGDDELQARIVITLRRPTRLRRWWARGAVKRLDTPFFRRHFRLVDFYKRRITRRGFWFAAFLCGLFAIPDRHSQNPPSDTTADRSGDRDDIQAAADKVGGKLFEAGIRLIVSGPRHQEYTALAKLRTLKGALDSFTKSRLAEFQMTAIRRGDIRRPLTFFLSHEELATLFHPATHSVGTSRLATTHFKELEAPPVLASGKEEGSAGLGTVQYKRDSRPFGIRREDRRQHLYVAGKTGMGKTTFLQSLIQDDINAGRGVAVIDPHGDLFETILDSIPTHRTNDVVVFDPVDPTHSLSFQPLQCVDADAVDLVADDVHSAFDRIYGFSRTSHRMSDTLRNALYVLIEQQRTLLDLLRFFAEPAFHVQVTGGIHDGLMRSFWHHEFPSWNKQDRNLTVAAIQNKVRPFLVNRFIRAMVSQEGQALNLRYVMDGQKILLVNLSKGKIGEGHARLLGMLLITNMQQNAMSRADVPEALRPDFSLYIDECQNYTTPSLATILSEARKYRLNLTLAHQYLGQFDEEPGILKAIFGNVGSMVCFQVGNEDAWQLAKQLSKHEGQLAPEDLTNIPKYHAYIRLLHEGMPQQPFSMRTLKPTEAAQGRATVVRRASNQRYARDRSVVLKKIEHSFSLSPASMIDRKSTDSRLTKGVTRDIVFA